MKTPGDQHGPQAQLLTMWFLYHSSPRPSSAKNAKSIKIRPAAIIGHVVAVLGGGSRRPPPPVRRRATPWTSREAALIPIHREPGAAGANRCLEIAQLGLQPPRALTMR